MTPEQRETPKPTEAQRRSWFQQATAEFSNENAAFDRVCELAYAAGHDATLAALDRAEQEIREYIAALDNAADPKAVGSTGRLIRAESALRERAALADEERGAVVTRADMEASAGESQIITGTHRDAERNLTPDEQQIMHRALFRSAKRK